jgi:hypothetical protein
MASEGTDAGVELLLPVLLEELPPVVPLVPEEPLPLVSDPPVPLLPEEPLPLVPDPPVPLLPEVAPLLVVPEEPVAGSAPAEVVRTPPQPLDTASPTTAAKNRSALHREVFIESP